MIKDPLFIEVPSFSQKWKELGFDDNDLRYLQNNLIDNPEVGAIIKGTGGVRKVRFAFEGRGKSGSVRVCYVYFNSYLIFFLLTVYQKKEKENLTNEEKAKIKKLVNILLNEIKRRYSK